MKKRCMSRLLFPVVVLSFVPIAQGEEKLQPFRATIQASEVLIPTGQDGVFDVVITGTGRGNLFGKLTFSATETIDFVSSPGTAVVTNGEFVITAADGSELFATYTGTGVPDPDHPGFFIGEATATITGGTGRFKCASGTVPSRSTSTRHPDGDHHLRQLRRSHRPGLLWVKGQKEFGRVGNGLRRNARRR